MRTFIRSSIFLSLSFCILAGAAFGEELSLENIRSDFQEAISHYNYNDEPVIDSVTTGAAAPTNDDTEVSSEEILDLEGKYFDGNQGAQTPTSKSNIRVRSR